jgi:phage tail-like protein
MMPLVNPVPVFDFTVVLTNATPGSGFTAAPRAVGSRTPRPSAPPRPPSAPPAAVDRRQAPHSGGVAGSALTGAFAEVTGLNAEMETEEYREGGLNTGPHQFIKWGKYPNLVFKRGVTPNTDIWDWYYEVLYGDQSVLRKNGIVVLTDRSAAGATSSAVPAIPGVKGLGRLPIAAWSFINGLPQKLQGPGLNAKSNEIAIETLEIVHEGLIRLSPAMVPGVSTAMSTVGVSGAVTLSASTSVSLSVSVPGVVGLTASVEL